MTAPSGSGMFGGGKTAGLSDEEESKISHETERFLARGDTDHHGIEEHKKVSAAQPSTEEAKKNSDAFFSELQDVISSAFRSVAGEGDTSVLEGSVGESSEAQRRPKKMRVTRPDLQGWVEELLRARKLAAEKKNQPDTARVSNVPPPPGSSITQPPPPPIPPFPRRPKGGTSDKMLEWRRECRKISEARKKAAEKDHDDDENVLPTLLRDPKDYYTSDAVQDWRSKQLVLAAARSTVSVTSISDDGQTRQHYTGFVLRRYEHSGLVFSVIVTCSMVVCKSGKKLDPLPKLSVVLPDRKTVLEAKLLYFSDHFGIALLLVPTMEFSLDIARLGCCPDYDQKVFVLGRDNEASLIVRHGVISWTQESGYLGRDYYMFLDGQVPCNGGPVIDHDGEFIGMAFRISPEPAILSISTIMTCLEMFMRFRRIARPMLGLGLRTIASLDVERLEECISQHNIRSGYIVEVVDSNSPALKYGIRRGDVIVSLNGHNMLTLPKLEDYLLSLGWENLVNSVTTIDIKLEICDLKGPTRSITMPVGFCSSPEGV